MCRVLFSFLALLISSALFGKTVYIVPMRGFDEKKLYCEPYSHRDEWAKPFCALREEIEKMGYEAKFTHDCKDLGEFTAIFSFEAHEGVLPNIAKYPKEKCFLFCWDPPVITPWAYEKNVTDCYQKIFVMFDDLVDNVNYFKFHCPQPRFEMVENALPFSEKKLCSMIATYNCGYHHPKCLYPERIKMIFFFEDLARHEGIFDFDLYGKYFDGWLLWKGTVPNKWDTYKNYKFAICYENMGKQEGYITEKIFDCFVGGCVPIYLGAENITDYIPKECFIDRRNFSSDRELYEFIKHMDEKTYNTYIQAIKEYLQSDKAKLYSIENFVKIVREELTKLSTDS